MKPSEECPPTSTGLEIDTREKKNRTHFSTRQARFGCWEGELQKNQLVNMLCGRTQAITYIIPE